MGVEESEYFMSFTSRETELDGGRVVAAITIQPLHQCDILWSLQVCGEGYLTHSLAGR